MSRKLKGLEWLPARRDVAANLLADVMRALALLAFGALGVVALAFYAWLRTDSWPELSTVAAGAQFFTAIVVSGLAILIVSRLKLAEELTVKERYAEYVRIPGHQIAGNTLDITLLLNFTDPTTNAIIPTDLSGTSVTFSVFQDGRAAVKRKAVGLTSDLGRVHCHITASESGKLKVGDALVEVTASWPDGRVFTWPPFVLEMKSKVMR